MVRLISRRRDDDSGAALVLTAALLLTIFGLSALVIDIANVHQNRLRAQATADAAVLAAAQELPDYDAAVAVVKEYALRNDGITDTAWAGCTDSGALEISTFPCISTDAAGSEVRVRLPGKSVSAFFATVVGKSGFIVSAAATAEIEFGSTDSGPGSGFPGDSTPGTPSVRDGDPGGGYPPCATIPDWQAQSAPASAATNGGDEDEDKDKDKKKKKKKTKWSEFIFVFEHLDGTTTTVCGTSRAAGTGNNAWVPDAGGSDSLSPTGIQMHVSCSDIFFNGWTDPTRFSPPFGPLEGIDTEWRVVRYTIDKYREDKATGTIGFERRCGDEFTPISSTPPVVGPDNIRLID